MLDARPGVAKDVIDLWLNRTFTVPMSLRSDVMADQRGQRTQDIYDAIHDALPRNASRGDLLDRAEAARKRLAQTSKTMAWPTPSEIRAAFRETAPSQQGSDGSGPTEYVVESTARWVRRFGDWPGYLENPSAVFDALVMRGEFNERALIEAGFPCSIEFAAKHGIVRGVQL